MKTLAKRLTPTLLVLMMAVTAFPTSVFAAEDTEAHIHTEDCTHDAITVETENVTITETPATSGLIGESNVEWNLDTATGRLTFTGSGDCEPFTSADDQPWAAVRDQITEVWFTDMAALTISDLAYWFDGCSSLVMAEIPYTTPVIGERAFADCTALKTILLYYMDEPFSITAGAFETNTLTALEVRYVPSSDSTLETLAAYKWSADNRIAVYNDVYGVMQLATVTCPNCDETSTFTKEYEQWSDTYHTIRGWCDNCGEDIYQGTNAGKHTMSDGVCTLCGYDDGSGDSGDDTCYHDDTDIDWDGCEWEEYCADCGEYIDSGIDHGSTYTEWDGCDWYDYCNDCDELMDYGTDHGSTYTEWSGCSWYEYCNDCDELMDSGTEHGSYTYGDWEYYNSSRHRRLYGCENCGEGSYSYGYHSTTTEYTEYSSTQHKVGSYCSTCSSYVGSSTYESHSFTYGSWSKYSSSQHRRSVSCSTCGYSSYEYASHSLTYGSWTEYSDTQHKRTVSCSTCSYSTTEYASHSYTIGDWENNTETSHIRQHLCSCGYSVAEAAAHDFTYGDWENFDDTQHRRSASCDCGYSGYEYADHQHTEITGGRQKDETQHILIYACTCGHSVENAENHIFSYRDWTVYSETEHSREYSCDCGYSDTEYDDHADSDTDGYCDECDYLMLRFSVTVPALMTFVVSGDGEVYAAANAEIINNSTYNVEVTSVTVTAGDNWTLVPYDCNMADEKVDSKMIGFSINDAATSTTGSSENLSMPEYWGIDKNETLPLEYDAVISATSEIYAEEQVLTVVFILNWGPR